MLTNINDVSWGTRSGKVVKESDKKSILSYIREMEFFGLKDIFVTIWHGPKKKNEESTVTIKKLSENESEFVKETELETTEGEFDDKK